MLTPRNGVMAVPAGARRPEVVAFDVVETLVSLESLRARLAAAGQPSHVLELWFARLLRDAFALTAAGDYRPFPEVASAALSGIAGERLDPSALKQVVAGFAELDAHPDAAPAVATLAEAGVRMVTLTNGGAKVTGALLERAGIAAHIERVISVEEVRAWKPSAAPYLHAAHLCGVPPDRLALVAAHSWDIHGARRAGLCHRLGQPSGAQLPGHVHPGRRHRRRPGPGGRRAAHPARLTGAGGPDAAACRARRPEWIISAAYRRSRPSWASVNQLSR